MKNIFSTTPWASKPKVISDDCTQLVVDKIAEIEKELAVWRTRLYDRQKECKHKFIPDKPYDGSKWFSAYGHCHACGKEGGWWCSGSPDGECDYKKYGDDQCEFCGLPDERK